MAAQNAHTATINTAPPMRSNLLNGIAGLVVGDSRRSVLVICAIVYAGKRKAAHAYTGTSRAGFALDCVAILPLNCG